LDQRVTLESLTESICRLPVVGLLARALLKSHQDHAKDMAASIAYFSFFSLFPLLLGVIAGASFFLDSVAIKDRLYSLLADALPGSSAIVRDNVEALTRLRGAAGAASVAGLLWSASKMFGAVSRGINHALGLKSTQPFFVFPLRYFLMAITVSVLLFFAMAIPTILELLSQFDLGLLANNLLGFAGGHITSYVFVFTALCLLYRFVPYEKPSWREVVPGALFSALLLELGKTGFVFYIDRVAHLEAVYGSVSSIIVLLLWLYFSARVLLLGSELIAVRREQTEKP
jgi:YihY family inner membrane protein